MNVARPVLLIAVTAMTLAACSNPSSTDSPSATAPAAQEAAHNDPNAINDAIPPEAFKVRLSFEGEPSPSADAATLTYRIKVENQGSAALYGAGSAAVNLGGQILADDGTAEAESGGVRDFYRAPLPLIQPGQSATVDATISADVRLNGKNIRFALVQEGIAWHDDAASSLESATLAVSDDKFQTAGN